MQRETLYIDAPLDSENAKKIIAWTLDFVNSDLNGLEKPELWKFALDLQRYLLICIDTDGSIQDPDLNIHLTSVQKALEEFFDNCLRPVLEGREPDKFPPDEDERFALSSAEAFFFVMNDKLAFVRAGSTDIEAETKRQFINALRVASLDVGSFQRCVGCERYFLQRPRKRRFCTHLCNLRFNARQRSEKKAQQNRTSEAKSKGS